MRKRKAGRGPEMPKAPPLCNNPPLQYNIPNTTEPDALITSGAQTRKEPNHTPIREEPPEVK